MPCLVHDSGFTISNMFLCVMLMLRAEKGLIDPVMPDGVLSLRTNLCCQVASEDACDISASACCLAASARCCSAAVRRSLQPEMVSACSCAEVRLECRKGSVCLGFMWSCSAAG